MSYGLRRRGGGGMRCCGGGGEKGCCGCALGFAGSGGLDEGEDNLRVCGVGGLRVGFGYGCDWWAGMDVSAQLQAL